MELRQLEYFVAVAEEASFTRAAERVHISQSGVSAQVRRLELELGIDLIDRAGRTATVTSAGAAVLDHARSALASAAAVRGAADDVAGLVRGALVVGMVTGCTITPLFDALAGLSADHPGVGIELVEDTSDVLVDRVRSGTLDLALVGVPGDAPADLESRTIVREGLVAAVPPGHPLAGLQRAPLADVAGHPVVCLPEGTGIRGVFERSCAAIGATPHVALQASAPDAVADLAVRGLGAAVLAASMVEGLDPRLHAVEIDDLAMPALLALVWRRTTSPALRALLVRAHEAFGEEPGQD
ncbi:LysR family transcriptional regulator [Patulibacter minatonensis]|uniref:LysR family transcriptional regulator n=1 Tax=Patulibacter minatonensis TaxID=298163 RepID=UPI00047C4405|nr:LysR family transcriptional regulator [Patulibacter minatonensis]